jgi:hypothetical protein
MHGTPIRRRCPQRERPRLVFGPRGQMNCRSGRGAPQYGYCSIFFASRCSGRCSALQPSISRSGIRASTARRAETHCPARGGGRLELLTRVLRCCRRTLMSIRNFDKLFRSRSAALIGAGDGPGSVGAVVPAHGGESRAQPRGELEGHRITPVQVTMRGPSACSSSADAR